MREPERSDLSPLDPRQDSVRWERMMTTILARSVVELRRRRLSKREFSIFEGLLSWARPALATVGALTLISLFALSHARSQPASAQSVAFFRTANMPAPMTIMLEEGEAPSLLDLMVLTGEN